MGLNSFSPLDFHNVQQAFQSIEFKHAEMLVLTSGLSVMFAVFNIMKASKPILDKGVDASLFFKLFKEYAGTLALILFMPFAIDIIEYIFSEISEAYRNGFGGEPQSSPADITRSEINEATDMFLTKLKNIEFFNPETTFVSMIDGILTLTIKPFFVLVDNWSYGLALVYRFIYLGALKLTAGVALACYIYEPTRHYFFTWVKNLLVCYLLIPGFLFVVVFIDAIRDTYLSGNNMQLGILIICLMAKIAGFAQVQRTLQSSF